MCVFGENRYKIFKVNSGTPTYTSADRTKWIGEVLFFLDLDELEGHDVTEERACLIRILERRATVMDRWQRRALLRAIDGNGKETKRRI